MYDDVVTMLKEIYVHISLTDIKETVMFCQGDVELAAETIEMRLEAGDIKAHANSVDEEVSAGVPTTTTTVEASSLKTSKSKRGKRRGKSKKSQRNRNPSSCDSEGTRDEGSAPWPSLDSGKGKGKGKNGKAVSASNSRPCPETECSIWGESLNSSNPEREEDSMESNVAGTKSVLETERESTTETEQTSVESSLDILSKKFPTVSPEELAETLTFCLEDLDLAMSTLCIRVPSTDVMDVSYGRNEEVASSKGRRKSERENHTPDCNQEPSPPVQRDYFKQTEDFQKMKKKIVGQYTFVKEPSSS